MPSPTFPDLSKVNPNDTKAILDALAKLQKELNWLMHTLDSTNIASLTGEKLEPGTVGESQLADGAVTGPKIAALAIGSAHIQDAAITTAKIENGAITNAKIANAAIDSAKIAEASIDTVHIKDAAITNAKLGVASVDTANIKDLAVTSAKIQDGAITNAKIANASIDSAKIANAAVGSAHIQNGAIDSAHIKQGVISNTHIADASITDAKIVSVSANKVSAGTIDTGQVTVQGPNGKLRITSNRLQVFDNQQPAVERVSIGDVNGDGTVYGLRVRGPDGQTVLYDHNGVYSEGITDGAVTNPKIADGAVDTRVIAANAVTADKIVAGAVTAEKIASNSVTANHIQAGAVTSDKIAANAVTASKIAAGSITTTHISTNGLDASVIKTGTMFFDRIRGGTAELGGSGNGNGLLIVRNASDAEVIRLDNQGIKLSNGAKLIGDSGVLSVLTFQSDWQKAGWWEYGGSVQNATAHIWAFVPANFVVTSATLVTRVMSRYLTGWSPIYQTPDGYYTIQQAVIYHGVGANQTGYYDWPASSESVGPFATGLTNVTTALWGGSWSPPAGETIQVRSADVTSYIQPGQRVVFAVKSGTTTDSTNGKNAAAVQFELTVVGYKQ